MNGRATLVPLLLKASSLLLAPSLLGGACGQRPPPGLIDAGAPIGTCQHTCTPDPGSRRPDCAAEEADLEFLSPALWDFNGPNATGMYSYTDKTAGIDSFAHPRKTYEPVTTPMPRCTGAPDGAVHIQGGPFLAWGGGVGMSMTRWRSNNPVCVGRGNDPDYCPPPTAELFDTTLDLTKWEGLSFWARRGPDSQAGFRVGVGDVNTDDDISYNSYQDDPLKPRRCERIRECDCLNHQTCQFYQPPTDPPVMSVGSVPVTPIATIDPNCKNPGTDPGTAAGAYCGTPRPEVAQGEAASGATQCNTCSLTTCNPGESVAACTVRLGGPQNDPVTQQTNFQKINSRCNEDYPAFPGSGDKQFNNKPCTPYTFRSGTTGAFCFDPETDPPPAESDQQCGDHWVRTVGITTDWHLYTVRFDQMLQQGFGKRFGTLDLTAVSVVRFTWDGGWIDYWLDDVRFYRAKKR